MGNVKRSSVQPWGGVWGARTLRQHRVGGSESVRCRLLHPGPAYRLPACSSAIYSAFSRLRLIAETPLESAGDMAISPLLT